MCELTFHAEQRLRLRIYELKSSGVCIDDFEQEIIKAIEHACNGEYVNARNNQRILCMPINKCSNVMVIIIYTPIKYNGKKIKIITVIPTTKDKTIKRYCNYYKS
ncbi:hypothetical protein Vdis_1549 [Vulcanisaeta distributa DSM 14429]|uniref:DUF4258 domain-containing protein n=2 Tax=Vulcanisaeta distributa TaxID=164451 RepID=E1QTD8_VULDI|nr:hypothetical protein Vdis_1549 [Vulcanisaeta distributa DSM 14429]